MRLSTAKEDMRLSTAKEEDMRLSTAKEDMRLSTAKEDMRLSTAKEEDMRLSTAKEDMRLSTAKEDMRLSTAKEEIGRTTNYITSTKMQTDTEALAEIFHTLSVYYIVASEDGTLSNEERRKNKQRSITFERVGNIMDNYGSDTVVPTEAETVLGIGDSSGTIIQEYNNTGDVQRLRLLETKYGGVKPYFDAYMMYYGIGPKKAIDLYNRKITTEEDLLTRGGLTSAQKLGVLWFSQYSQPIPRIEMNLIDSRVREAMGRLSADWFMGAEIKLEITGSYRRGSPYSNDVDILVARREGLSIDIIVEYLDPILKATLKQGEDIYHGILRLSDHLNGHRVDILLVDEDSWYPSLLHFTGSKNFNILMAKKAMSMGGILSRKEIVIQGSAIPVDSEKEIFDILGVQYLEPSQRNY
jgi:DNA polymerase/3'-5' exonuclease PolX